MSNADSSLERFREEAIEKLSASYASDHLTQTEFEERVEQATSASSHQELRRLLMDLPVVSTPNPPAPTGSGMPDLRMKTSIVPDSQASRESSIISIFSGASLKGVSDPSRSLNVVAFFGGSDIDLRDARIPAGGITINVFAMFGGVDIIVPDDLNVEVNGAGIFGGFDGKNHHASDNPLTPTVKVNGVAFFGGANVKIKRA